MVGMDGKRVYRERLERNQVDVSALAAGIYVLEIRARKGFRFSQKIMVR
ncbi:MAG: T9SS type A sorting domain-containing protein [Saprospiraceae bacterium]